MGLTAGDYLEGALFFFPLLALCAGAGWIALRRLLPALGGLVGALAWFLLTTTALLFSHLLPGVLTILTRGTALATAALILAGAFLLPRAPAPPPAAAPEGEPPSPWWSWALALAALAASAVAAIAYLWIRSTAVVDAVDAVTFHMPTVARWIQTGSVWGLNQFSPEFSNATYPQNGVAMQTAVALPWDSTFLVRYVNVPFVIATGVALWAIARELGAPSPTAMLAGAVGTALPAVAYPAMEQAQVDAPSLAWLAIGALFLLRWVRSRDARELVPAGLGLGLAFGTKWYDVVFVPLLVALCLAAVFWAGRRWSDVLRPAAVIGGLVALAGAFWLIRNWVETGNPIYPGRVAPLGITIFDAPVSRADRLAGFRVWDYITDVSIWRDWFVPAYKTQFGLAAPLALLAMPVAAVLAWRTQARRIVVVAFAAALLVLLYTRLPWTAYGPPGKPYLVGANARYAVPGLMAGLVLAAWVGGRAARLRPLVELALAVALADCLRRAYPGIHVRDALPALAAVGLVAALIALRGRIAPRVGRPAFALAAAALILLAALGTGEELRRRATLDSYAKHDPVFAWIDQHAPSGRRIGLTGVQSLRGINPPLAAFGPRLGNEVVYIGPFVRHTLQEYRDRDSWQAAARAGRYDAILVGLGFARELPPEQIAEVAWSRELGYTMVARSRRMALLANRNMLARP